VRTPKGVRVTLGKIYMYPDGHANLEFDPVPAEGFGGLNLPLTKPTDVIGELVTIVQRMEAEIVKKRPGQA
jgi:hypothetical protein